MATSEGIKARITSKEKALEKLNKKLERINKAEASNWEDNPYYYDACDKGSALREIADTEEALKELKEDLEEAEIRERSRNIPAILDFLEQWKNNTRAIFVRDIIEYYNALHNNHDYYEREVRPYRCNYTNYKTFKANYAEWEGRAGAIRRDVEDKNGKWYHLNKLVSGHTKIEALDRLEKMLKNAANAKYDFLVSRVLDIVGEITDASNLYIGNRGDLNGFIIGTNGKARVETIGAGGYNIQAFHYRCLVHKMKED